MITRTIFCCSCNAEVRARLTDGKEIYPHRPDLFNLPFWKCNGCGNFVGCHHKTKDSTRPLGVIPSNQVKQLRKKLHAIIDPLWKGSSDKRSARKLIYCKISEFLGYEYHAAEIRSVEEAERVLNFVQTELR